MLKTTVSKSEFKAKALEYMRFVQKNNQSIIVTDMGNPVIQINPYNVSNEDEDELAFFRGSVLKYVRPNDPVGLEDWEALKWSS